MSSWLLAALTGCGPSTCDELARHGIEQEACPDSELRLGVNVGVSGLVRGGELPPPPAETEDAAAVPPPDHDGLVVLDTRLLWLEGDGPSPTERTVPFSGEAVVTVSLLDRDRKAVDVGLAEWRVNGGRREAYVALPDVPDGNYVLKVDVDAGFDRVGAEVPLAFFAPALVHVLSDRPLYRPGEEVRLRSLVLRRADRTPLAARPGQWRVIAPDGAELLTESDTAGEWGVADTSLPLRQDAVHGRYRAIYSSGADRDEIGFDVRPFVLPRVTAEVVTDRAWYREGDELVVRGVARYASGAPVAGAAVTVALTAPHGGWPIPLEWEDAKELKSAADGTFRASFGEVPRDLVGRVELAVDARVVEPGGETVDAATTAILSEETLQVEAMTELGDGLVGGFNNRAYLRITSPDGVPLAGARIEVANPWAPTSRPKVADADEDGVVAIQIDPGDPVTVVHPAFPVRQVEAPPPDPAEVTLTDSRELGEDRAPTLPEHKALDRAVALLAPCRGLEGQEVARTIGVQVSAGGAVTAVLPTSPDPTSECVARRVRGLVLPPGKTRTFRLTWKLPDSASPRIHWDADTVVGDPLEAAVEEAVDAATLAARACVAPGEGEDGAELLTVHWTLAKDATRIEARTAPGADHGVRAASVACVERALATARLEEPAKVAGLGVLVGVLDVPAVAGRPAPAPKPQPTTSTGYELRVSAFSGGRTLGDGPIVLSEGRVPSLRLRPTPSIMLPGETVAVEILRGPGNTMELPEELVFTRAGEEVGKAAVDGNTARFTVPEGVDGFLVVELAGVRAQVFVERPDRLALALATDRDVYRPGETATLTVTTTAGGRPTQAGVGLVGVDATLGRIAKLPGPDEYGRVTVQARSADPPFGRFDAVALLLGRIRGRNAAQAAVQRVTTLPSDRYEVPEASGSGAGAPDRAGVLAAAFARAFGVAVRRVREWERSAAPEATFDNAAMVEVWDATLAELRQAGAPAVDAWGRELALARLPADLLAQLDPRQLVQDGTHLPEDMVGWTHHVAQRAE